MCARIGLLLPSSNTTMEPEFYSIVPKGVTVHTARMLLKDVTPESLENMADEAVKAAELLATAEIDVMVYGCTSGSLVKGVAWEAALADRLQRATSTRTITTAGAVVDALKEVKAHDVMVATPYIDELNQLEERFLEAHGFQVTGIKGLGLTDNQLIGKVKPKEILSLINPSQGVDSLFISCTNLPVVSLIQSIESRYHIPVVTSNQASLWSALSFLGQVPVEGYGSLLKDHL
jgi:maleate isomerase